jgi:hypothetical protein
MAWGVNPGLIRKPKRVRKHRNAMIPPPSSKGRFEGSIIDTASGWMERGEDQKKVPGKQDMLKKGLPSRLFSI